MNVLVVECSGGNSRPSCPSGVGGGLSETGRSLHPWPVNPRPAQASFGHVFDQLVNSYRAAMALPTSAPSRSGMSTLLNARDFLNPRMLPQVRVEAHPAKRSGPAIGQRQKTFPAKNRRLKLRLICRHFGSIVAVTQVPRPQCVSWVKCPALLVLHIGPQATGSIARILTHKKHSRAFGRDAGLRLTHGDSRFAERSAYGAGPEGLITAVKFRSAA